MNIYRTKTDYRRVYIKHHGSIPVDQNGRSFDIHHIDGNSHNNNIENLVALSRYDHFMTHLNNGDFFACILLSGSIEINEELIRRLTENYWTEEKRLERSNWNKKYWTLEKKEDHKELLQKLYSDPLFKSSVWTEERRHNYSEWCKLAWKKGIKKSPSSTNIARYKISQKTILRFSDITIRRLYSEKSRLLWQNKEFREKQIKSWTPERRKHHSEKSRSRWTEEKRLQLSEIIKTHWTEDRKSSTAIKCSEQQKKLLQ